MAKKLNRFGKKRKLRLSHEPQNPYTRGGESGPDFDGDLGLFSKEKTKKGITWTAKKPAFRKPAFRGPRQ